MSIKEEFVEVVLNPRTIKHYENLGYSIPRVIDKQGKLRVKRGTKIWVKVSDLPPNSNTPVTAICENPLCEHPERIITFQQYSDICQHCYNHSEEHRLRHTGENSPMFGRTHTKEAKEKMSKSNKGKNNPNYNPNLTDEERAERKENRNNDQDFVKWSLQVKERDNFKCVIPECNNHDLESHHLDNWNDFPESRYDLDNGVTLCLEHHTSANGYSFHNIFGFKGNIQEQFDEYLKMFI